MLYIVSLPSPQPTHIMLLSEETNFLKLENIPELM